jgi:hypothetical protein
VSGFVDCWSPDPIEPGRYTGAIESTERPVFVSSGVACPFCGTQLQRVANAHDVRARRVAYGGDEQRNGRYPFVGSPLPSTHDLYRCGACVLGFSSVVR